MTAYQACLLCGIEGPQIEVAMVEWAEPIGSKRFEVLPVCRDRAECRQRVEQQGEPWPLVASSRDRSAA